MAVTRMTLAQLRARAPDVDWAKLAATTEADIRQYMIEDGQDPDASPTGRLVVPAAIVRRRLGMTQRAFADLIGVPLATLRNWEQKRVIPKPAARALMMILVREPEAALRALAR